MNQPENERIEGEVAFVISRREILLTVGVEEGVELGMRFAVLGSKRVTNQSGAKFNLSFQKTTVKIVRFENDGQNAVGRTFKTIKGSPQLGTFASTISILQTGTPDRVETMKTDSESTLRGQLSEQDELVTEGDLVRETKGNEYDDE